MRIIMHVLGNNNGIILYVGISECPQVLLMQESAIFSGVTLFRSLDTMVLSRLVSSFVASIVLGVLAPANPPAY